MTNYIVYNSNGEIIKTGVCPSAMVPLQVKMGEYVIEGNANDIRDRVVNGKVVPKSQAEIDEILDAMKPDPIEVMIQNKIKEINRRVAIKELKDEGKL